MTPRRLGVEEPGGEPSPWLGIGLDVYEQHMAHAQVGQLSALRDIMREQIADNPGPRLGILGVAGGNGLDLIDPANVQTVYGYDLNPDYLAACDARYRPRLGDRLRLVETSVDRSVRIESVDLLVANLFIEYVGIPEFAAFAATNADRIAVLSCVTQRDEQAGFVSSSPYASAFDGLSGVSADIDADDLTSALRAAGFARIRRADRSLPNGKMLIRQDFTPPAHGE